VSAAGVRAVAITWKETQPKTVFLYHAADEPGMQRIVTAKSDLLQEAEWLGEVDTPASDVVPLRFSTVQFEEKARRDRDRAENTEGNSEI
jgi:hypothetical protein